MPDTDPRLAAPSYLDVLMDERGWAEGDEAKAKATFRWMEEATKEIARLHAEVASLGRVLASRTDHLV